MNSSNVPTADRLMHQHRRWTHWAWPLAVITAGLAATLVFNWRRHPTLARVEQWHDLPRWWLAGLALTALLAMGVGQWRRNNLLQSARQLDERFDAKNRLETSAALRHDPGALALAQRQEVARFLQGRDTAPATRRAPFLVLCTLAAALVAAHFFTLLSWTRPWLERAPAATPAPAVKPAAPALPRASIRWKTPASETKAAPIEEVPLQAVATSTSGLRDLTLEIAVNGQPRPAVPIPADELKGAGEHPIQASIYLDQLEVEPFDVVSYHLQARRIDSRQLPETVSSVQFVQVRPLRSDVREMKGGEGYAGFALVTALKVAQLRLIKENFVLAHAEVGKENDAWKKEDGRVGGEQEALQKKTAEAVQQLIEDKVPAEVINLLMQAQPFMGEAAQKIRDTANEPALGSQGKALSLITEVEKYGVKLAARDGKVHGSKPNVDDPFKDKQQFELKQRFKTAAGELETLAAAQAKLADELARSDAPAEVSPAPDAAAKPPDPQKIEGTPVERQTQISQRIGALLNGRIFNQEITGHLEQARDHARESLSYLDAGDGPAAREPAAAAARELQLAADAVDRAGEEQAKLQLADAQHTLNEAADQARDAARQKDDEAARQREEEAARRAQQAAKDLLAQAREQQETGSADAAKRLNELAKAISADDLRKSLEGLRAQPRNPERAQAAADRLQQLADAAAQARHPGAATPEELARLIERLERDRANLQRLAANDAGAKPDASRSQEPAARPQNDGTGQNKPGGQEDPKKGESSAQGSQNKDGAGQATPSAEPLSQGQGKPSDQPGQQGQGKEGKQGRGRGQQGQGQQGDQSGQSQPGGQQGQQGQGQNPTAQGTQPGQGSQGQGKTSGQQNSQGGKGQGGNNSRGNQRPTPEGEGQGPGGGKSTDGGDTYGTSVGETRYGPPQTGVVGTKKPVYTDHAPRDAQTRDPGQAREEFARELLQDVREATQEAAALAPKTGALAEVREVLRDMPLELHYFDRAAWFAKIDPPLSGLINSLRGEAQGVVRRAHRLTDPNLDRALPAYRAAVADYFEQLSRDYDAEPPAASPATHE